MELFLSAIIIMLFRIADVTIGTFRTILIVNGKKYYAAIAGFFEVLIWILAMKYIVQNLDNFINLIGYASGFALGNILGITIEQKIGFGYAQVSIISKDKAREIVDKLRRLMYGATVLPAEGFKGNVTIIIAIVKRKETASLIREVEAIDPKCFINIQPTIPYRGFIHGSRK